MKSVRIRSYSGLYFPAFGLNTDTFVRSVKFEGIKGDYAMSSGFDSKTFFF